MVPVWCGFPKYPRFRIGDGCCLESFIPRSSTDSSSILSTEDHLGHLQIDRLDSVHIDRLDNVQIYRLDYLQIDHLDHLDPILPP